MKKHIHVYRVVERAEVDVEADTSEKAEVIALEMAQKGELEFSDKGLDDEMPYRFLAVWYDE